jgi:hypothetical protein
MTITATRSVAVLALLCLASPACAGPCASSIVRVQARVDAAIDKRAGAEGWKPESLDAKRSHQPTPSSIAGAEGGPGMTLQAALDALDRARAADGAGDDAACRREVASAKASLRQHQR